MRPAAGGRGSSIAAATVTAIQCRHLNERKEGPRVDGDDDDADDAAWGPQMTPDDGEDAGMYGGGGGHQRKGDKARQGKTRLPAALARGSDREGLSRGGGIYTLGLGGGGLCAVQS